MKEKTIFKCNVCGKVFKRKLGKYTYEVECPKCKEVDVDIVAYEKQE